MEKITFLELCSLVLCMSIYFLQMLYKGAGNWKMYYLLCQLNCVPLVFLPGILYVLMVVYIGKHC